jgi:choline dehydrogenase-like flavoprotein
VRYDLNAHDTATFKRGLELLTDLYWAAGAKAVLAPAIGVPVLRDGDSGPLQRASIRARDLELMAFHPLGTARAGADPGHAVLDGDLAVHGASGVYVADGSAVPTSLGVNPQITIMALATRLAFHLLDSPAPADEPPPERIAEPRVSVAHVAA